MRIPHGLRAALAGQGPPSDPYFSNVSLLLHGDGTNGSTTIIDSSNDNLTITANGNAQITTGTVKYGTGALVFDGVSTTGLEAPDSSGLTFGTGSFTIELWWRMSGFSGVNRGLIRRGTTTNGWRIVVDNRSRIQFYDNSTLVMAMPDRIFSANTWYHLAIVREGTGAGQTKMYLGGILRATGTSSTNFTGTHVTEIGYVESSNYVGFIDDLRITKNVARYTANFTPPTEAFLDQ